VKQFKMKLWFTQQRRVQNQSEEAERSHLSPDFTLNKGIKRKSGDNGDQRMVLQSK